ncbi:MAG: hypothetical protein ACXVAM_15065 [Vulcanimicrobiaceae bacterium]
MRTKSALFRASAAAIIFACTSTTMVWAAKPVAHPSAARPSAPPTILYTHKLPDGSTATIYSNRLATIAGSDGRSFDVRPIAGDPTDRHAVEQQLTAPRSALYAPNRIIVVFRDGIGTSQDVLTISAQTLASARANVKSTPSYALVGNAPRYTNSSYVNSALARIGVDRLERIARSVSRSRIAVLHSTAQARGGQPLNLGNAFLAHVTGTTVLDAVHRLRSTTGVAYVEPDWAVKPLAIERTRLTKQDLAAAAARAQRVSTESLRKPLGVGSLQQSSLPSNYAVTANSQSMLAATGDDAFAAYDTIKQRYGQLPGAGEIITNVSIGDITDSSALSNFSDPCQYPVGRYGPTTHLIAGQHYLDWPSMPLIPVYTSDSQGNLSGSAEACNTGDSFDGEIGLDFSMMAPLPHDQQRGGAIGSGYTDLLGIAPGASYRLIVPQQAYTSDIVAAFMAAANQMPAPNVITASIGFGFDTVGFPGRYFDEDPLVASTVQTIVNGSNVVVCISANDGTRTYTNAAIGPSGGSAATNLAASSDQQTNLDDIGYSTAPSSVVDTGSIDVGGTTLDDIFAVNPSDPANTAHPNVRSVTETRYTGFTGFSSGFGSRINIAAPSDNVLALQHALGNYSAVEVMISGGTSASAPQVAAAAAIALQVARLTGHPFAHASDVRTFLQQSGNPVSAIPQADQPLNIGNQLDVARMVERLLTQAGQSVKPALTHVSIMQRNSARFDAEFLGGRYATALDSTFTTDTDPGYIDLAGPTDANTLQPSGMNIDNYITIAPDWEGMPAGAQYQLSVQKAGKPAVLATTASVRLLPAQILTAAGLPVVSPSERTVTLTYRATEGFHALAQSTFTLTFGPSQATTERVFAPIVAAVSHGPVMSISYDFSAFPQGLLANPFLVVSHPGRVNPLTGSVFFPAFSQSLYSAKGTINVPLSALQGDGIYGVGIVLNGSLSLFSDFAYTRVQTAASAVRANAPTFVPPVSSTPQSPAHFAEVSFGTPVQIAYDVTNVPSATGAILEVSAAGPTIYGSQNPFNNPNGSVVDANGYDTGSAYEQLLPGTKGTITLTPQQLGLTASMGNMLRVIPVDGSTPAGEASDAVYLAEDGAVPGDGGSLLGGFSIGAGDGLLTSSQPLADGEWVSSVYDFDQSTLAVNKAIVTKNTGYDRFDLAGNGLFATDLGLYRDRNDYSYTPAGFLAPARIPSIFATIPNAANAMPAGNAWSPALATPTTDVVGTGTNSLPGLAAFLIRDTNYIDGTGLAAFTSDVGNGTFGPTIPLQSFTGFGYHYTAFDYDPTLNKGFVVGNASMFGRTSSSIIQVDFNANSASEFPSMPCGGAIDFAIDATAHLGVLSSLGCDSTRRLQLVDLNAQTFSPTSIPAAVSGFPLVRVAADPVNHLFLAELPVSPDAGYNNNSLSSVVVVNEQGRQVEAIESFNFLPIYDFSHYFRVNGSTRRGFVFGAGESQVQPFTY